MIFKTAYKKGEKYLVKIVGLNPDDVKGTWATTTSAVYNWAKKTYEDGDEVDAEYNVKNGEYTVTRITKGGEGSKKTSSKSDEPKEKTCADCGKKLKDDKYDKCYTCNQKSPTKSYSKSTEDSISRQNANHATSRTLLALQGQVDINNIFDIAKKLHEMYLKLARGEKTE